MKTTDLASTLEAFAALSAPNRVDDLHKLADVFRSGKEETVAARVKKWSPISGYPSGLKSSLVAIRECFTACGATKQEADMDCVLSAFVGSDDATSSHFITAVTTPLPPKKKKTAPPPQADNALARTLADELTRTVLDTEAFKQIVTNLRDKKHVNTPTLAIIANRFLGNSKFYTGRKEPLDDIVKRQKADAREHLRGKALNRIGV